ncbi:WXG100 family type VII secretion target [Mycobacterium sp. E136]|uniref:WXG100 family type VII secretion target n=1 Tax=Mycobacterium sp. E136 TaxID=1834125 RepID=UPI0009FF5237
MAEFRRVDADRAFDIAHAVANDAEALRTGIVGEWDSLSRGWSGIAALAYTAIWEEWHEGAAKVVESLAESSRKLTRSTRRRRRGTGWPRSTRPENAELAHIPLEEWLRWSSWSHP